MTMTSKGVRPADLAAEAGGPYRDHKLPDAARKVVFEGRLLAATTSSGPMNDRWTELALYRHRDGRYVLHVVGCSDVYHAHGGACNNGVPTRAGDLAAEERAAGGDPDDNYGLVACRVCRPTHVDEAAGDGDLLDVEKDRYAVYALAGVAELMARLRDLRGTGAPRRPAPGAAVAPLPGVAHRLLTEAARYDDGLRDATRVVERL